MSSRQAAWGLLGLLLVVPPAWADAAPRRLGNLNREPSAHELRGLPSNFFQLGERLFFSTADPQSLDQGILWSTDGSARGTQQVSTILCPTRCVSIVPLGTWRGIELLRITILDDIYETYRLGRTDGTTAGTFLLTGDLFVKDSMPLKIYALPGADAFIYPACPQAPCSLWRSDGTVAGTAALLGPDGRRFVDPHSFTVWRERLYFVATDGEGGTPELWSTDGIAGGTRRIHEARDFGSDRPGPLVATPSHLFFTSGETGEDLWATDGSPEGTRRLADFAPTPCDAVCETPGVYSMTARGDEVFFGLRTNGHPFEIWRSDGTIPGTRRLRELPPEIWEAVHFRRFGEGWLFRATDVYDGDWSLWTAGDDFQNAAPLTLLCDGDCPILLDLSQRVSPGIWFFTGYSNNRNELWSTDGRRARRLANVCLEFDLSPDSPDFFPGPDGKLYFRGCPRGGYAWEHNQLWVTDGSPAGTYQIGGQVSGVGFFGGQVYFGSSPPAGPGAELWVSGGERGPGRRIAALRRYRPGSEPEFQVFGERVLIAAAPAFDRVGLWTSDGTKSGTLPVAELPADIGRVFVEFLAPFGSRQLFTTARLNEDETETAEIWRTDGTVQGTEIVTALSRRSFVNSSTPWNGKLLFCASQAGASSIGITDGTARGTREIFLEDFSDLCPTVAIGSRFVFLHQAYSGPSQLFVSDGSPAGTRPVAAFDGHYSWIPVQLGETVYFQLMSGPSSQLWQTDGTPEGTRLTLPLTRVQNLHSFRGSLYMSAELPEDSSGGLGLFRFRPGKAPVLLSNFPRFGGLSSGWAPAGDRLVFSWQGQTSGFEIWATDGTPEGTRRLHTFERLPNDPFPRPEKLASDGRRVFFAASDGVHGRELWETDGTPEGTRMVVDLAPGGYSALPAPATLYPANGDLFFAADDGKAGVEPWALPLNP